MKLASLPTVTRSVFSLDLETFALSAWRGQALESNPNAFVSIERIPGDPSDETAILAGAPLYADADFSGETPLIRVVDGSIGVESAGVSVGLRLTAGDITTHPFHCVGNHSLYSPVHRAMFFSLSNSSDLPC